MSEPVPGYDATMSGPQTWLGAGLRLLSGHPHLTLSLKSAVAAAIAWIVVQPLPGVADTYPYYAPLGAVIAVSSTVVGSVRESAQGVLAIMIGAAVALIAVPLPIPEVLALAIVVAVGTVVSYWPRLGGKGSWVPISALFVLIVGSSDPMDYVVAYLGLTSLGAVIGVGLNLLFPPLPLSPTQRTVTRLRETLAEQLDDLADGLLHEEPLTSQEWQDRRRAIRPLVAQTRGVVEHATEARRGNWRAGRRRERADQQYEQSRALEQLAFLVEDVTDLVTDHERAELEHVALGAQLRPYAAHALGEMAEVLRTVDGAAGGGEQLLQANEAVDRLADEIRQTRQRDGDDLFSAGSIVTAVRRGISALAPTELESQLPTDW
jgi:uncharacterized membrane protein YgaE (UPF0421/DUF939 family)